MAYDKSIIDIDINFDNEPFRAGKPPRPVMQKKIPKDRITIIQPSLEAQKTSLEISRRVVELEKFRRESLSAVAAPLLVTALIRKTHDRLKTIKERSRSSLKPIEKFQWAARVVHVLVSSCMRWRRYKKTNEKPTTSLTRAPTKRKPSGIGFDSKTFKEKSKISEDIRAILTTVPRRRTLEQLKKVQRLCRTTRAFNIFPLEREMDLARYVAYERYDNARVVACQDRLPERFYYVLSGRISKVCLYNLAAGVTKMSFGELMQGATTDPREIQENIPREHSLICKGSVEVLVLDREDFMDLMTTSPDQGLPTDFLRSIELFRSFPMEKFKEEMDSITTKYFARDSVIVKDSSDSPYFFILKSGRCKVVRQQDVLDVSKASKLPRIPMASKPPTRATPGKNPTSLLEFTKCHTACSKESFILDKLRANKAEREQGRVTEEGIITDTPSPEAAPLPPIKRKHDYTKEVRPSARLSLH